MQAVDSESFETYLKQELEGRKQKLPEYSLRTYARDLRTDVSQLSKILAGKRRASEFTIQKLGENLGLNEDAIYRYRLAAALRSEFPRVPGDILHFASVPQDHTEAISDIRAYTIFELIKLKDFRSDLNWIAKKISCTVNEAASMIMQLKKIGLVTEGPHGELTYAKGRSITSRPNENVTSPKHRAREEEVLKQAIHALNTVPVHERDQSSVAMATNKSKIAEAKRRITAFRRELDAFLEDTDQKDCVYQLSLSLFPISELNSANEPGAC